MTHELYKTKEEIENWLNQYNVNHYELIKDKEYGYVVNVNKSVTLKHFKVKEIKVKFNIINGNFDCSFNNLNTLKGVPETINGDFNCNNNNLNSFDFSPKFIKESFNISKNKLKTLKGAPEIINKDFNCNDNKLKTLEGCPEIINGYFFCCYNKIKNLRWCPKIIKGSFYCHDNLLNTLEYFPNEISRKCYLINNPELKELQSIEDFNELKKIHYSIILNKKLENEIHIDNIIKTVKIKL